MIKYDDIVSIEKIEWAYHKIWLTTKHREKLVNFELNKFANIMIIYSILKNRNYKHGFYNIFLIKIPKHRIIMSENLLDKIINHVVSEFVLSPLIEPKLLDFNVATRKDKGLDKGLFYVKKYLNLMRHDIDSYYLLKCDISKYFYNISHDVLYKKLDKIIEDKELLNLIMEIVNSTDNNHVNQTIKKEIKHEIEIQTKQHHQELVSRLLDLPIYIKGYGLPIGNMTSQILAIFYLNDLDHYIKEQLHIKYYVRYMDDFLIFHQDLNYLKECRKKIEKKLQELNLSLNKKTNILKVRDGFSFLGYRFSIRNKRIYILPSREMTKKIRKRVKKNSLDILNNYNGYLQRSSVKNLFESKK